MDTINGAVVVPSCKWYYSALGRTLNLRGATKFLRKKNNRREKSPKLMNF